jgi:tripartite-type tricarboxylate transporter receptor subunit TctC
MQRTLNLITILLVLLTAAAAHAQQKYPTKPIRFIVPYPPGGSTDYTAREIAPRLSEALGQQLVIDNRGGAGSLIGHSLAAAAVPDGYTLVLGTSSGLAIAPVLGAKLSYNPQKDFAPIGLLVHVPYVLVVHASIPTASMKEFIDYAKKMPGKLNYGSSGTGTPNHLGGELMDILAGVRTVHVPYKGGGPAITDLLGGQLQFMFSAIPQVQPHVKSGRLRALAVGHPTRTRAAPDLPPVADTLPGFNNTTWYGLLAPARTPRDIVTRINADLNKLLAQADFTQRMLFQGVEAATSTPEGLGDMIRSETERWRTVIKRAGLVGEAIR